LNTTFSGLLKQVQQRALGAQAHQDLPFEQLVEALHPERSLSHSPLFQVMYNHHTQIKGESRRLSGLIVEGLSWESQTAQFDLTLDTVEYEQGIGASLSYATALFDKSTIERFAGHWINLLQGIVKEPNQRISELSLLSQEEHLQIIFDWSRSEISYPSDHRCIHQLIEAQTEKTPDAVAVVFGDRQLIYQELNRKANQLAHKLRELGVGPDVLVGIAVERSLDMVIGLLAILKAGGAYVPLDPEYPKERLAYMMVDSSIQLLLTQSHLQELPIPETIQSLYIDQGDDWLEHYKENNLDNLTQSGNLAYVIYTSGSTGRPKGVAISHEALSQHAYVSLGFFNLKADDRILQFATLNFDGFVEQLYPALICGASVVIRGKDIWDSETFYQELISKDISVVDLTTAYWFMLAQDFATKGPRDYGRLHQVHSGGEAMPPEGVTAWKQAGLEHVHLLNTYGPTEATVTVCAHDCADYLSGKKQLPTLMPIGKVLPGRTIYLLDDSGQIVTNGIIGELAIGGELLARGYFSRPTLTAERFVPNPFYNSEQGGRLYRTGDLARYRADGVIEYVGRIDQQVKIRGFRIELGEIEARLQEHEVIRETVVIDFEGSSGKQLVGYLVADTNLSDSLEQQSELRASLRNYLKGVLPDYMVPTHLLFLDKLPLTPNGKLDRKALPKPDASQLQQKYISPQSELEQRIAAIWADVLKIEKVGLTDNFFELGGDSIISLQVVIRARQVGIQFTPKDLFRYQTVQELTTVACHPTDLAIDQGLVIGSLSLTPIQQCFFDDVIPERNHWNQSVLLQLREALDVSHLKATLQVLIEHHDVLRLRFEQRGDKWFAEFQDIEPVDVLWTSQLTDIKALEQIADEAQCSLSLEQGPLLRGVLVDLPDNSQRLLLVIHHLVVDGVSWRILLEDLQQAYQALAVGQPAKLPKKTSSIKTWAEHLKTYAGGPELRQELDYWRNQLQGVSESLPCDHPDGGQQLKHAAHATTRLSKDLTRKLLQQAPQAYRTQVNDLLLTALARVVGRWTGRSDVLIRLEGHGREDLFEGIDLTRTVGWFTSMYPVRLSSKGELAGSIKSIKEQLRAIPSKGIGYGLLRYLGNDETKEVLDLLPQGEIVFNYLGQFDGSFDSEASLFVPAQEGSGATQNQDSPLGSLLALNGQVYKGELSLDWTFSREVFEEHTIQRLADEYAEELEALVEHCCYEYNRGVTPSDFPLLKLSQEQLDSLPIARGDIADIYPLSPMQQGMLFHTLYEQEAGNYINQMCVDVEGLDTERFRQAWESTLEAHDILRTGFVWQGVEQPVQVVYKSAGLPFATYDWRAQLNLEGSLSSLAEGERAQGFDLGCAPLLRLVVVRTGEHAYHLIYTCHHILMDGWSNSRLLGEVLQRYVGEAPERTVGRYKDYIAWLERQDPVASESFWKGQLAELEEPTRLIQSIRSGSDIVQGYGDYLQVFDAKQTDVLKRFAQRHKVTVNTLVQSAWLLLLQRYTGQETVCFGATVAGRPAELRGVEEQIGLFINTLPVIGSPRPEQTVVEWIQQVQARNLTLREFEHTPLYEVQRWAGLGGEALFDSLLVFENYPVSEALRQGAPSGLHFGEVTNDEQTNYPLSLGVGLGEALMVHYGYGRRYFDSQTIARLADHFGNLLRALAADGRVRVGELSMLGTEEHRFILTQWDQTQLDYPSNRYVHQLIEDQARQAPDAIAVIFGGQQLTYGQLDAQANRLAHKLVELGVGPEVRVVIAMRRSAEIMVSFLAVLKAGGTYVPLDITYPQDRLLYMMQDCAAALVLVQGNVLEQLPILKGLPTLVVDRAETWRNYPDTAPDVVLAEDNLAYVIYTSGSTGQPKGVAVSHGPLVSHIRATGERYETGPEDCELHFMSFAFDGAHEGWMHPLISGARVLVRDDSLWLPEQTYAEMHRHGVTLGVFPPVYLQQLAEYAELDGNPPPVRIYCFGGDAVPQASYDLAWRTLCPQYLFNGYGPTETVVTPLLWKACKDDPCGAAYAPIGTLLGKRRGYVLDADLNLLPVGVAGELYLGGQGVARGYLERPGLTAERFVPDPFDSNGERVYRSGDLTRARPNGLVDYLGRVDHQVKVRGFRIELGEIEARLLEQDSVREAVVLAQDGASGKQLVGYVVPSGVVDRPEAQSVLREDLRAALKARLPEYMVPVHLLFLEELPLTPNGKLDRKALPKPDASLLQGAYVEPRTELERKIAVIWQDVLKLERVGLADNFFELGGHSLLATQVTARMQIELGVTLPIALLFQAESLQAYILSVDGLRPGSGEDLDELREFMNELEVV
jgi:amino acid adenylation domain-containing protein/non-ribosomal peptide synthase protein (TIGR01720 family)